MSKNKTNLSLEYLKKAVRLALGTEKSDLLLQNVRIVNVFTGESYLSNILIDQARIIGISSDYTNARKIINCGGAFAIPGLIDGHIHIESSLLNLKEFARLLLTNGTTTVVADPHEICNVLGTQGLDYILRASQKLPLDIFLMIPSCVPSSHLETTGGKITTKDILKYISHPRILGLAEVMNFPAVISAQKEILEKITATLRSGQKLIDGHCPRLTEKYLHAYINTGIYSDHECIDPKEAQEKLRAGMYLMIREGSGAKNLTDLFPIINLRNARRCLIVSDDKHPDELIKEGHLNAVLKKAVGLGLDPFLALQMVTLNPAEYFRLYDRGAIAPGKKADLVVVDSLTEFNIKLVIKNGTIVVKNGELQVPIPYSKNKTLYGTIRIKRFNVSQLKVKKKPGKLNVIKLIPNQIITDKYLANPKTAKNDNGREEVVCDLERDLLKIVVVERHKKTGNLGIGFVSGFGFKKGAIASSVAHDAHNIIAVGTNDSDIYFAIKEIAKRGGGYVAVSERKVRASLELPIAGLMSDEPAETVAQKLSDLISVCKSWGSKLENPFITLSFLALPVIPILKITDRGLVDVSKFKIIDLFSP